MANAPPTEAALVQESIEALRRIGFLKDVQVMIPAQPDPDGQLKLKGPWGTSRFHVEVQPKLSESSLPALVHRRQSEPKRLLLVTSYVPPRLAELLQERRIEFLDAAGNAYLDRPAYIFVSGKKPIRTSVRLNRALRPAGLRLLYVLLKDPAFLTKTQRELAAAAGIALGSVPPLLQDLRERGYLRRTDAGPQTLTNARELFFRWEQAYGELLRPKLLVRTCRLAGSSARIDDLLPRLRQRPSVLVGGELGAAILSGQLRAETATLHIEEDEKAILSALRLMPDPQGNIALLKTFGMQNASAERPKNWHLTDPLLIHAELVQLTGDRIQEIAKILLDQDSLPRLA